MSGSESRIIIASHNDTGSTWEKVIMRCNFSLAISACVLSLQQVVVVVLRVVALQLAEVGIDLRGGHRVSGVGGGAGEMFFVVVVGGP